MGTNHPQRREMTGDVVNEYRVTGMYGFPKISGTYSEATLGIDARSAARNVQQARGGIIQVRQIITTDWSAA